MKLLSLFNLLPESCYRRYISLLPLLLSFLLAPLSMAPPKKTKTMGLDYEQQRQENIKRNREMIASILHQKSQLASILSPPKANKNPINKRTKKPNPPLSTPRQSLRFRGLPPPDSNLNVPTGQFSFTDAFVDSGTYRPLVEATFFTGERREHGNIEKEVHLRLDARVDLGLKKENVRRVVGESITIVRFLPVFSRSIVISGNKKGYLGIWDADLNREGGKGISDGLFVFFPHRSPVSGISVHPSSVRKVYSSCYYGDLCRMDMEKEMFDIIYSSDFCIFSLSQSPHDHNSLFLDLGARLGSHFIIKSFDERAGRIIYEWELHNQMVNTIDFHPENSNMLATSSTDGFVRIWDLRCIDKVKPKSLKEVAHNGAVHSAYFSPTGNGIVSTSIDNTVRILSGPHFEHLSIIMHNNQTGGRMLPSFRAIWGWNDSYIFIGNTQRAVDVISTEDNITTPLQSEYLTNIPCRFATHPYKEGHLACAAGPKLYLWTKM
ncbi:WD repeat-containing protein 76 [Carex littledalei]|uniref:WD repeat-containing protein 76 n=1 Tax=Carex littledalei TaxID=544730 RepID=A0A833QMT0_9POAL|nr:WD repeat-containing protein 76 [Carex littledalei]